jgi:hypothetical protein
VWACVLANELRNRGRRRWNGMKEGMGWGMRGATGGRAHLGGEGDVAQGFIGRGHREHLRHACEKRGEERKGVSAVVALLQEPDCGHITQAHVHTAPKACGCARGVQ